MTRDRSEPALHLVLSGGSVPLAVGAGSGRDPGRLHIWRGCAEVPIGKQTPRYFEEKDTLHTFPVSRKGEERR